MEQLLVIWEYAKRRFAERSTYVAIANVVASASVIPAPWCYLSFALGVAGLLIPDGPVKPA